MKEAREIHWLDHNSQVKEMFTIELEIQKGGKKQTFYVTGIKVKGKGERVKPASIQVSMNTSQMNKML